MRARESTIKAMDEEALKIIRSSESLGITCQGITDALHEKYRIRQIRRSIKRLISDGLVTCVRNHNFDGMYNLNGGKRYAIKPIKNT